MDTHIKYKYFTKWKLIRHLISIFINERNFHKKRSDIRNYEKILSLYLDYLKEALMRGYPIDIPGVGLFKMFSIKHLESDSNIRYKRSIKDSSISFILLARGALFTKYEVILYMSEVFKKDFHDKFADTDKFYELMGKDEQNKFRTRYY